jgi:hypothetical protein
MARANGVLQGACYGLLTHHGIKGGWAVFAGAYYELFHPVAKITASATLPLSGYQHLWKGAQLLAIGYWLLAP